MADDETKPAGAVDPAILASDDTVHDVPLLGKAHEPEPEFNAAARLRAFEDEKFPDAVRIDGRIERGYGSPFQKMGDADKAVYAALERLVEAEQKLSAAHAALIAADAEHDAALAAVEAKSDAAATE